MKWLRNLFRRPSWYEDGRYIPTARFFWETGYQEGFRAGALAQAQTDSQAVREQTGVTLTHRILN